MFSQLSLHEHLLRALAKIGIDEPTPVQRETVPLALQHKDLLVSAETGSGKTIAFLLPTLQQLLMKPDNKKGTRVLILVPTRELARQIFNHFMALASYTQFTAGLIIGGESFQKQMVLLRKNPELIIATPGRMKQHLERNTPYFSELEVLILDEADRMLDMGFSADVLYITGQCNKERQTLLFSATLNHRAVKNVAGQILNDPVVVTLNTIRDKHASIRQQVLLADDDAHKIRLLDWLLKNEPFEKALIFTNTKVATDALSSELRKHDHRVAALNGDMDQVQRNAVMDRLHKGVINILVATDVAARGLDVPGIALVVNFDMARNGRDYVHRIGRTGRAGQQGLAVSLIDHHEWNQMAGIERYLEQKFERRRIKALEGNYKGPKKVKASGKAAGPKKSKVKNKASDKAAQRHRNRKQIGKRRKPSNPTAVGDGTAQPAVTDDRNG